MEPYQNESRLGGRKPREVPFVAVGAPNADPVAAFQPHVQQSGSQLLGLPPHLGEGLANPLVSDDADAVAKLSKGKSKIIDPTSNYDDILILPRNLHLLQHVPSTWNVLLSYR